jgi:hypothetical protein
MSISLVLLEISLQELLILWTNDTAVSCLDKCVLISEEIYFFDHGCVRVTGYRNAKPSSFKYTPHNIGTTQAYVLSRSGNITSLAEEIHNRDTFHSSAQTGRCSVLLQE